MTDKAWHSLASDEVVEAQGTSLADGLSVQEAKRRLETFGPNELMEQPRPGWFQRLLDQFRNFVVLLLIAAAIISGLLGEVPEAIAIILIVVLNAILGIVQEGRAEQALDALKKLASPEAHVLRGGHVVKVPEREVVPGDVVLLEAGNYVPADIRLAESSNLRINESSLTGESEAVEKSAELKVAENSQLGDRKTMAFRSTIVTYGRGKAVAVGTGMQTEIGKIAELIQSVGEEDTPLQVRLDQLGRWLAYAALAISGLVFVVNVLYNLDLLADNLRQILIDSFLVAVALAIAAVPEGLPAVVTINLALGMREMIKRNALIRRLPAVETLGSASAICSDKTGTLTQNVMTVVQLYVHGTRLDVGGEGQSQGGHLRLDKQNGRIDTESNPAIEQLLRGALLASDALLEDDEDGRTDTYKVVGDPTEAAMVVAAAKGGMWREKVEEDFPRVDEIPFDSTRKRMTTLHEGPQGHIAYVKGAPDFVMSLCNSILEDGREIPLSDERRSSMESVNQDMGEQALRVLAVAYRKFAARPEVMEAESVEKNLTLVGFVAMRDPARPEVPPAIAKAKKAGIRTIMVTGDYPNTARAIAKEIGLLDGDSERVMSGAELDEIDDNRLAEMVDDIDVFARVSPTHKVRIVEAFRNRNYVVAMTGDGVNDAPALKRASIGIAMGITGTDVSKETADMVLTDDNYRSIVSAVEQGRIIYSNIRKFVYFLLSANVAEIVLIFVATSLGLGSPLTPIQLLWLNLVTDGAPALALGVEKGDPDVMERPPRPPDEPIIDRNMRTTMGVLAIVLSGATLAAFFFGQPKVTPALAQTMAFVTISLSELFIAYTSRSELFSVFKVGFFSNRYMQYAFVTSLGLLLMTIYVPGLHDVFGTVTLGLSEWSIILPLTLLPPVASEITKIGLRAADRRRIAAAVGV